MSCALQITDRQLDEMRHEAEAMVAMCDALVPLSPESRADVLAAAMVLYAKEPPTEGAARILLAFVEREAGSPHE